MLLLYVYSILFKISVDYCLTVFVNTKRFIPAVFFIAFYLDKTSQSVLTRLYVSLNFAAKKALCSTTHIDDSAFEDSNL